MTASSACEAPMHLDPRQQQVFDLWHEQRLRPRLS